MLTSGHTSAEAYSPLSPSPSSATQLPPPLYPPDRSGSTSPSSENTRHPKPTKRPRIQTFSCSSPRRRSSFVAPGSNGSISSASVESGSPPPHAIADSSESEPEPVNPREAGQAVNEYAKAAMIQVERLQEQLEKSQRKSAAVKGKLREAHVKSVAAEEKRAEVVEALVAQQAEAVNARKEANQAKAATRKMALQLKKTSDLSKSRRGTIAHLKAGLEAQQRHHDRRLEQAEIDRQVLQQSFDAENNKWAEVSRQVGTMKEEVRVIEGKAEAARVAAQARVAELEGKLEVARGEGESKREALAKAAREIRVTLEGIDEARI